MSEFRFTKRRLEALTATGEQYIVKDPKTPGLILLVSQRGGKTFFLRRRVDGKDERIRIGQFPTWTVEQAQRKVDELNDAINKGANPNALKRSLKSEPTLEETFNRYVREKLNRHKRPLAPRTVEEYQKVFTTYLSTLAHRKLSEVKPEAVKALHTSIQSPAQANKVKALLSGVFRWAAKEKLIAPMEPTRGIQDHFIQSRERFLQPAEVGRFLEAVEASTHRDFFLLALLTGARRANLLAMQWRELDLADAVWVIPKTKNGDAQRLPLPPAAVDLLVARKAQKVVHAVWVFPGSGQQGGHMHMPRRAWSELLERADLDEHLRLHDLRRTLGSWMARQGTSLPIIGKSLGHKTQQATAIYSRLDLDPVRAAMDSATAAILGVKG